MTSRLRVAIGEQLKACSQVITLGVRSQMVDYSARERELLRAADIIFYPTVRFVDIFATLGKETFPSANCYRLRGDRQKQTALFRLLDVPHPRTRVYYGLKQKREILKDFEYPFLGKKPFGFSDDREIFLIQDQERLDWYNQQFNPAYVQEYIAGEREIRIFVLNCRFVTGCWREGAGDDLRCRPAQSGIVQADRLPTEAVSLARYIASSAGLTDVAVDFIFDGRMYWATELNFRYDDRTWRQVGQDRLKMVMDMIERGEL